jgi:hypothetical protein
MSNLYQVTTHFIVDKWLLKGVEPLIAKSLMDFNNLEESIY